MYSKMLFVLLFVCFSWALQITPDTLYLNNTNSIAIVNNTDASVTVDTILMDIPVQYQGDHFTVGGYGFTLFYGFPECPTSILPIIISPRQQYPTPINLLDCCRCPTGKNLVSKQAANSVIFNLRFCTNTDTAKVTIAGTPRSGSVEQMPIIPSSELTISPNPCNLTITLLISNYWKGSSAELINSVGRKLLITSKLNTTQLKLNTDAINSGIYLLILKKDCKTISKKLVILK